MMMSELLSVMFILIRVMKRDYAGRGAGIEGFFLQ